MTTAENAHRDTVAPRRRPSPMLWWTLGLIAAFLLMAISVAATPSAPFPQPLDDWWRGLVGASPDSGLYRTAIPSFFQSMGEAGGYGTAVLASVLVLLIAGRWRSALFFLSSAAVASLVFAQATKKLVSRPRPSADEVLGLYGPIFEVDHGSFPSGHVVGFAALIVSFGALIPASRVVARRTWWVLAVVLVAGMMWQRTLVNAHWLSDTFFGAVGGVAGALLVWWAYWPWLQRDYGRPVRLLPRRSQSPDTIPLER